MKIKIKIIVAPEGAVSIDINDVDVRPDTDGWATKEEAAAFFEEFLDDKVKTDIAQNAHAFLDEQFIIGGPNTSIFGEAKIGAPDSIDDLLLNIISAIVLAEDEEVLTEDESAKIKMTEAALVLAETILDIIEEDLGIDDLQDELEDAVYNFKDRLVEINSEEAGEPYDQLAVNDVLTSMDIHCLDGPVRVATINHATNRFVGEFSDLSLGLFSIKPLDMIGSVRTV